ncbi:MAG: hypothetical protein BWK78_00970 [Thiotrichaceae bacterium IS1]|nr:MAG: hypothetical protein BWK78_00970 [Thiotrichaceae bacterium IS1]
MTNPQKFLLKFDTDSEAQASALAAELENTLRAEKVPVERRREKSNAMNLGEKTRNRPTTPDNSI